MFTKDGNKAAIMTADKAKAVATDLQAKHNVERAIVAPSARQPGLYAVAAVVNGSFAGYYM